MDSPPGETLGRQIFTLRSDVFRMKVEKEAQGFLLLLRSHSSGYTSTLNATPTFVLILTFSCSCQFSFNS